MSALRSIGAVVAGVIVAAVVMMGVEFINGHHLYPELGRAAEAAGQDRDALRELMATVPVGALAVVIVGWILGSFAGGFVAAKIATTLRAAISTGIVLTCLGVVNNLMIPSPAWFWGALIVFLPSAWLGGRAAGGK